MLITGFWALFAIGLYTSNYALVFLALVWMFILIKTQPSN